MIRGTICWVNLEDTHPPEFGKTRPGVVVSNSEQNVLLPTVVIVPLSSQAPEIWPLRLELEIPGAKKSYAVVPGLRQISKKRIEQSIGVASVDAMNRLTEAIEIYLRD